MRVRSGSMAAGVAADSHARSGLGRTPSHARSHTFQPTPRRVYSACTLAPAHRLWSALAFAAIASAAWFASSSITFGSVALAQADGTPPEAVEFYRLAREHYEAGQYRQAAEQLERALVLDPDSPTLVYNVARVYELLGELDRALEMYERYQRLLPEQQAREQERAASTIRRLRGARRSGGLARVREEREVEPLRQLPGLVLVRENGVADAAFWVTLASGVASLAAAAVLGILALDAQSAADHFVLGRDGMAARRQDFLDRAETYGIVTDAMWGVGAAAVVTAGLLYFLREHTVERAPVRAVPEDDERKRSGAELQPSVWVDPGALGATLRGRF